MTTEGWNEGQVSKFSETRDLQRFSLLMNHIFTHQTL